MTPDTTHHETTPAVQIEGLRKRYGEHDALSGVTLSIPRGSIYGILGPNGAGKTTLVRILATLIRPDGGRASVFGHDVEHESGAVRQKISLTGQSASVDEDLTATENLVLLARLLGYSAKAARIRAAELLAYFDLAASARWRVATFSGGMRRRLDIAASLIAAPSLLFLDEPTTGLDPRSRSHVWQVIRMVVARGATVVLTTQYLEEADQLAHRIAVIDRGLVVAEGTRAELKASVGAGYVRIRLRDPADRALAAHVLSDSFGASAVDGADPAEITVRPAQDDDEHLHTAVTTALAELDRAGVRVSDFSFGQASLDEVFLALTGHRPNDVDSSDADAEKVA
jgi:ABC-2 type transport system ATP-binding protein